MWSSAAPLLPIWRTWTSPRTSIPTAMPGAIHCIWPTASGSHSMTRPIWNSHSAESCPWRRSIRNSAPPRKRSVRKHWGSHDYLFAIVKRIVDAGAQFRSLAEPWADTATSTGRLMIAVLGGLADVERDLIRTRTAEGRSRAKARGQHMGRPPALTPQQQAEARKRRDEGATLKELAQSYNVGLATIFRLSKKAAA